MLVLRNAKIMEKGAVYHEDGLPPKKESSFSVRLENKKGGEQNLGILREVSYRRGNGMPGPILLCFAVEKLCSSTFVHESITSSSV